MRKIIRSGLWAAMVTPYTADNKIDYRAVLQIINWYAAHKVDGIFAVCQSSEMHFLTLDERVELALFVVKHALEDMGVVISGHISDSIEDQIAELQAMAAIDADALILNVNRMAAEGEDEDVWKKNCQRLLDTLPGIPLGLYECPIPYARHLSPELLKWCVDTGRFVYLKDVCCSPSEVALKAKVCEGSNLKIFTADTATLLDSLKAGADGYCGIMANFCPEFFLDLVHNWRTDDARATFLQHFGTLSLMIADLMYPVCAKYCLQLEGLDVGLVTRNRKYEDFSETDKLYARQVHALWKEIRL